MPPNLTEYLEHLAVALVGWVHDRRESNQAPTPSPTNAVLIGQRLPLGTTPLLKPELVSLDEADRRKHLYVLGATGAGKTTLLLKLVRADLAAGRTLCLIDLRGDLVDRVLLSLAHQQEDWGDRLALLDLRNDDTVVGFNPLSGVGDPSSHALHVLGVLEHESTSWGVQLEETLRNCLLALAEAKLSLLDVEPLLTQRAMRARVLAQVSDPFVRSFFERFDDFSDQLQLTWRLPVLNKVSPLLSVEPLRLMLGSAKPLDLHALLNRPGQVVLIALAVHRFQGAAKLIGSLLVSSIQMAITARADQSEATRLPVSLFVDEFETMASPDFEAIVAEGRRFGLSLTLSHQNCAQVPPTLKQVLRNNVHTQVFFQTGAGDAADLVSEIVCGESRDDLKALLMSQQVGEAIIVRRGQEPVRVKVGYDPDPAVSAAAVAALRQQSATAYGQPKAEALRLFNERWNPPSTPTITEVRYGKGPQLPRDKN